VSFEELKNVIEDVMLHPFVAAEQEVVVGEARSPGMHTSTMLPSQNGSGGRLGSNNNTEGERAKRPIHT